jgi:hypothetical protein
MWELVLGFYLFLVLPELRILLINGFAHTSTSSFPEYLLHKKPEHHYLSIYSVIETKDRYPNLQLHDEKAIEEFPPTILPSCYQSFRDISPPTFANSPLNSASCSKSGISIRMNRLRANIDNLCNVDLDRKGTL